MSVVEGSTADRFGRVVAAGALLQFLVSGLLVQSYGAYVVELQREFAWSATVLSAAYGLMRIESGLLGPVQGAFVDRAGPRPTIALGAICLAGGFTILAFVQGLLSFFVGIAVAALGASLCGLFTMSVIVVRSFASRRSAALGVMWTGFSLGGFTLGAVAWSFSVWGWRSTALISGVVMLVVVLALVPLLPSRDGRYLVSDATRESVATVARSPVRSVGDITLRAALRSSNFWLMSAGQACALLTVGALLVHLVPYVHDGNGFSLASAAIVVASMNIAQVAGNTLAGVLGDLVPRRTLIIGALLGHAIGVAVLSLTSSLVGLSCGAAIHGLAWGLRGPIMQVFRADLFGQANYGKIAGVMSLVTQAGMVGGPVFLGMVYDITGAWTPGFVALVVCSVVGAALFAVVRVPTPSAKYSCTQYEYC